MRSTPRSASSRQSSVVPLESFSLLFGGERQLSSSEAKVALARLRNEIGSRLRSPQSPNSQEFFLAALRALGKLRGGANIPLRIDCLYDCGWFLSHDGADKAALSAVRQLDELSKRHIDLHRARRIEMLAGIVHAEMGDIAQAVQRHSNALRIARQADDVLGETSTLINLGIALNYGGLFKEAISCLKNAIRLARSNDAVESALAAGFDVSYFECAGLANLAQSYHYIEDNERALDSINLCLLRSPEPGNATACTHRVVREFTYVRIALDLGLVSEAREHTALCVAFAKRASSRSVIAAAICQGLCDVYDGNVEKGLRVLEHALEQAGTTTSIRMDALLALGTAAGRINQPAQALAYMEHVLFHIRTARERCVRALLSERDLATSGSVTTESDDLRKFQVVHANLRAQAAERHAEDAHIETLERLAITADVRDEESGGHGARVGHLASLFAHELGWPKDQCHTLELAGRLHDIGKIGLPDRILLKAGGLKDAERSFVAAHTKIGAEILGHARAAPLKMAQEVACFHHEHWDGGGYPLAISGERIPMSARIVSLADVFDALTHGRPYSSAWSVDRAIAEVLARTGKQFDPSLGARFVEFVNRLRARYPDLDDFVGQSVQRSTFTEARLRIQRLLRSEESQEGGFIDPPPRKS